MSFSTVAYLTSSLYPIPVGPDGQAESSNASWFQVVGGVVVPLKYRQTSPTRIKGVSRNVGTARVIGTSWLPAGPASMRRVAL